MVFDPYLWLHLVGLATLPLTTALVAIALVWGIPLPFSNTELILIVLLGGLPVWIVQIWRPWQPFGFLCFQIPPERMDERQKRILRLIQSNRQPLLNVCWCCGDGAPPLANFPLCSPRHRFKRRLLAMASYWSGVGDRRIFSR